MIHVMLDLETWGKRPGCDIRSIGACVFDPVAGTVAGGINKTSHMIEAGKAFYIACDNPQLVRYTWTGTDGTISKYPLARDPDTVKWWSEQSDDAQAAFEGWVDLKDGLVRFGTWLRSLTDTIYNGMVKIPDDLRLYAHGPQFDCSILEAAYHAVGLPVPWHYRAPRDTRTVFDVCGVGDHSAWMARYPVGTAHHALDDAISQARAVCAAMASASSKDPARASYVARQSCC